MRTGDTFLEDAARYFERRPTGGEDSAHWANVYNAKNCREIAQRLARYETALSQIVSCHADAVDVFPDWKEAADAMAHIAAKAMETGTAKTEGLGAKHDSAVAESHLPETPKDTHND